MRTNNIIPGVCPTPEKEPYTKREARAVIRDMERRHRRSKSHTPAVDTYQCPGCGMWHIASKRKPKFCKY